MTEFELHYIILETNDMAYLAFEFWVTFTFSLVVAVFIGHEKLNSRLIKHISIGYAFLATALLSGFFYHSMKIYGYSDQLETLGVDPTGGHPIIGAYAGISTFIIFLVGTIYTLYFIRSYVKENTKT